MQVSGTSFLRMCKKCFLSGHPVSFWGSKFYSTYAVTSFRMLRWQLLVWMVNGSAAVQSAPTGPTAKQMPTQLVTKAGSHVSQVKLCEQQCGPVLPGQMCHTFTDCELLSHKVGWLSAENVNSTSAQFDCTVPFTLVHIGKYRTEDKLKMQTIHKLNTTQKSKQCKTQQNKTTLV